MKCHVPSATWQQELTCAVGIVSVEPKAAHKSPLVSNHTWNWPVATNT
jgi:hypothetical protein